jgi:hypothetical protein
MSASKARIAPFLLAVFGAGLAGIDLYAVAEPGPALPRNPSSGEIWRATPLNDLLKLILKHKLNKARSSTLEKEALKQINVTLGAAHGNAGMLLKDNGNLKFPEDLQKPPFDKVQPRLAKNVKAAVEQLQANKPLDNTQVNAIKADFKELRQTLEGKSDDLPTSRFIASRRFLNGLSDAVKALTDKSAVKHFNGTWTPRGKNIAELVWWMSKQGLVFAPAVDGDEATYTALYNALRQYEAALRAAE